MTPAPGQGEAGRGADSWAAAVAALRRTAFLLERQGASRYRAHAFRHAVAALEAAGPAAVGLLHAEGRLRDLPGLGERTAAVAGAAMLGKADPYLVALEAATRGGTGPGGEIAAALRGDLHAHTEASDGTTSVHEMILAAVGLGYEYLAITDHSPRLRVANGLSADRLRRQIATIDALRPAVAPFDVLTGIEVDILDDGTLDQEPGLLDRLDVVVASVHSSLRMDRAAMTRRMVAAVADRRVDVLGHCTGRRRMGARTRPPSEFDARAVVDACAAHGVAIEVNCQPEREDPPDEILAVAVEAGCLVAVDSDAHAPGELDRLRSGCDRLARLGHPVTRIINTWPVETLLAHTSRSLPT